MPNGVHSTSPLPGLGKSADQKPKAPAPMAAGVFSTASITTKTFRPTIEANLPLNDANRLLGELNAYSDLIPDIDFFIKMHVTKEATQSSRIEGIQTEMDEALMNEKDVAPERRDDWLEVRKYIESMNNAIENLKKLPLSIRLLKETHKTLLSGARGERKSPGEIRISQNWIGGPSLKDAFFIPPHSDELPELLSDLEKFWHNSEIQIPELIKAAIGHYQFETIHPFLDGNGRIGRLLITLYLIDKRILSKPTLYLSDFFARNKGAYYDSLTMVRHSNSIKQWILFFLNGIIETSNNSKETFRQIIKLRQENEEKLLSLGARASKGRELLQYLYSNPVNDIKSFSEALNTTHKTAGKLVASFEELGILKEMSGYKRNKIYSFEKYLNIFR